VGGWEEVRKGGGGGGGGPPPPLPHETPLSYIPPAPLRAY